MSIALTRWFAYAQSVAELFGAGLRSGRALPRYSLALINQSGQTVYLLELTERSAPLLRAVRLLPHSIETVALELTNGLPEQATLVWHTETRAVRQLQLPLRAHLPDDALAQVREDPGKRLCVAIEFGDDGQVESSWGVLDGDGLEILRARYSERAIGDPVRQPSRALEHTPLQPLR